ncbi:MAG: GNAT family N-acetyltransferase [Verrucomicrobiota bacterium]
MKIDLTFGFIRPWEPQDLPVLLQCLKQERIRKNLRSTAPYPVRPIHTPTHFAIVLNHQTIGGIGFDLDLPQSRAHLGFWIDDAFSGKGFMSEVLPAICGWFQSQHRDLTVQASVYGWNPISQKVLMKVGFSLVAQLPHAIHYSDEVTDLLIFEWDSLAQKQWEARQASL